MSVAGGTLPDLAWKVNSPVRRLGYLLDFVGADCRFRTGHLMITNQLLYQMS
jgi:hypothetical protein